MVSGLGDLVSNDLSLVGSGTGSSSELSQNRSLRSKDDRDETRGKEFDGHLSNRPQQTSQKQNEDRAREKTSENSEPILREKIPVDEETPYKIEGGFEFNEDIEGLAEQQKRKDAMLKFMVSLEGELGIPPDDIVEAVQALDAKDLVLPAEQTVAKMMSKLDLSLEQADKAAELYAEMLVGTGYGAAALVGTGAVPVSDMNFQVMTKEQVRKDQLSSTLNQMRANFFEPPPPSSPGPVDMTLNSESKQNNLGQNFPSNEMGKNVAMSADLESASAEEAALKKSAGYEQGRMNLSSLDSDALVKQPKDQASLLDQRLKEFSVRPMDSQTENQISQSSLTPSAVKPTTQGFGMTGDGGQSLSSGQDGANPSFSSLSDLGTNSPPADDFASELVGVNEGFQVKSQATKATGATLGANALGTSGADAEVENVQEIIDQAQVILKRGGGVMRVKLNPEGLGHVDLKVDVKGENVNIQMVADHTEAKRSIERGIGELKENLALQKMNVESIKVDVSNEFSKHQEQERQETAAREFARDFLGNSRNGNQAFQQDNLPTPFQKYFNQSREDVEPLSPAAASALSAKKGSGAGRLHLVA